jgi:CrcB protein
MTTWLAVGCGGFLGALARHVLNTLVLRLSPEGYPLGTLVVNVLGCFALGLVTGRIEGRGAFDGEWRMFLTTGLLGAFTTFSALSHEALALLRAGSVGVAALHLAAHLALGIPAVILGRACGT